MYVYFILLKVVILSLKGDNNLKMNTVYSDLVEGFKKFDDSDKYEFACADREEIRMFYKGEYYGHISYYKNASKLGFQPTLFCGIEDNDEYRKVLDNTVLVVRELNGKVA